MGTKTSAVCVLFMLLMVVALPAVYAAGHCNLPPPSRPLPPIPTQPPHVKKPPKHTIPRPRPPVVAPPVVVYPPPAVINPPVVNPPPPYTSPPYAGGTTPPSGGVPGASTPPSTTGKCTMDVLRLGLCLDVLGLVHLGIRPIENFCCPVLQGLLEAEAALCLCTAIRLRVLNLNIYIPLALNVLVTCGKEPPPGYLCPAV